MIGQLLDFTVSTRSPFWIGPPEEFQPADPTEFMVHGSVVVGCGDTNYGELFDFECLAPSWLASHGWSTSFGASDHVMASGPGRFFMHRWDAGLLKEWIRRIVEVEGETPDEIRQQIRLELIWEEEEEEEDE